jgi:hypothetical protein
MFLIKIGQEHHHIGGYEGSTYYHVTFPFASDVSHHARAEHHYIGGYQGIVTTYSLDYHVTFPFASDVSDQAFALQEHHYTVLATACLADFIRIRSQILPFN